MFVNKTKFVHTHRDLSKQFWFQLDGKKNKTKKLNLLIEFSSSIFIKFHLKYIDVELSKWRIQNKLAYKILTRAPSWTCCEAYRTSRLAHTFYNFRKLNYCQKTDLSKTAWLNASPIWAKVIKILSQVNWFIFGEKMSNTLEMSSLFKYR